jgi:ABC transporter substrate binding protein
MGYALDLSELFRRMADDVHKILKGAKPGDIPIYQATKFELLINLKTAKAFSLTLPPALIARADEVIEGEGARSSLAGWLRRLLRARRAERGGSRCWTPQPPNSTYRTSKPSKDAFVNSAMSSGRTSSSDPLMDAMKDCQRSQPS